MEYSNCNKDGRGSERRSSSTNAMKTHPLHLQANMPSNPAADYWQVIMNEYTCNELITLVKYLLLAISFMCRTTFSPKTYFHFFTCRHSIYLYSHMRLRAQIYLHVLLLICLVTNNKDPSTHSD